MIPLDQEIMRHLCYGWEGFALLMWNATNRGVRINEKDLERLVKANNHLSEVISKQRSIQPNELRPSS